jgi:hypothetical protein
MWARRDNPVQNHDVQPGQTDTPVVHKVCMPHLKEMYLSATLETLCLVFSHFTTPSLLTLRLALYEDSVVYKPVLATRDMTKLLSLTSFHLDIYRIAWTEMHDDCLVAILPSRLKEASLSHDYTPSGMPLWAKSRPQTSVGHLKFRNDTGSSEIGTNFLSRWNSEHLEVLRWIFEDDSSFKSDVSISMDQMLTLTLWSGGLRGVYSLLSIIHAPALKGLKFTTAFMQREGKPCSPSAAAKNALQKIRTLEFQYFSDQPLACLCHELPIGELLGLEMLSIGMRLEGPQNVVDSHVVDLHTVLETLRHINVCPRLASLTIEMAVTDKGSELAFGSRQEDLVHTAVRLLQETRPEITVKLDIPPGVASS